MDNSSTPMSIVIVFTWDYYNKFCERKTLGNQGRSHSEYVYCGWQLKIAWPITWSHRLILDAGIQSIVRHLE